MSASFAVAPPADAWRRPAAPPALQGDEVHVWRAALDGAPADVEERARRGWRLLSADERQRARGFVQRVDRCRFVGRRAALRLLLARYLDLAPEQVALTTGPHGQPRVVGGGRGVLTCSCASSGGLALYGITDGAAVGVDVEAQRSLPELDAMLELHCAPAERRHLRRLAQPMRTTAFLQVWTVKEAYLKAVGVGLTVAAARVAVELGADADPVERTAVMVDGDPLAEHAWSVGRLRPAGGHVAAVVVGRERAKVVCLDAGEIAAR